MKEKYTKDFYTKQQQGSNQSAQEVVPFVISLVNPKSVVDIGCGVGTWLSVFSDCGILDILGVDGEYVDSNMLWIPKDKFIPRDLTKSFNMDRTFDLVVSLEVAEHLPEQNAKEFVNQLANLGDAILFSAAIPYQGGTDHINEQWQEYWVELFKTHGFLAVDCIRSNFWTNEKVKFHYRQNSFLFIKNNVIERYPEVMKILENNNPIPLSIVHPLMLEKAIKKRAFKRVIKSALIKKLPALYKVFRAIKRY